MCVYCMVTLTEGEAQVAQWEIEKKGKNIVFYNKNQLFIAAPSIYHAACSEMKEICYPCLSYISWAERKAGEESAFNLEAHTSQPETTLIY